MDEETKKNQNIINIVREGQISLLVSAAKWTNGSEERRQRLLCYSSQSTCFRLSFLLQPHLAADNLELIRDEDANNLLHISASRGHADCLQHLTSLMGEDGLNERNNQQLTPAGLGVKVRVRVGVNSQMHVLKAKKGGFTLFNEN